MFKQKLKASAFHLGISIFVVGLILTAIIFFWYPSPFLIISGLFNIILMLILIDVVLGPLLTFIVFKKGKSSLKFDLFAIAVVQVLALSYGIYIIYQAHPLYIAYAVDRFTPIDTSEVSPAMARYDEFKKSKLSQPTIVYVKKPSDPAELSKVTIEALSGGADLDARPEYYEPIIKNTDEIFKNSFNLNKLLEKEEYKIKINNFLNKHGGTVKDYAFIPLVGRQEDVLWAWSLKTKNPIDILHINPFTSS
ncbi:TfpX/TfpZ family type IV pilin accessory protein [uncultured Thiothrix sp.]|uniref:TfpX/TfpZ family type IV pilin accessory protein n=1 Tax=uncultured Thiothrix sp. TaxID=223185 RepID=UPI0026316EB6|nr:TfpX/TfpZ family type IV pilin accessory protein [uncultured Thiothrix sp.]